MTSIVTKNQKKTFTKKYTENGTDYKITVELRYDDECGNGHNTFAITADIYEKLRSGRYDYAGGGCCHDEIIKHFPEFEPLIKWHLMSSDGPMHYIANTLYHAGDRDYNGLRKGEPDHRHDKTKIYFNDVPLAYGNYSSKFISFIQTADYSTLAITEHPHKKEPQTYSPKYSFTGYADEWYQCPFDNKGEAESFLLALKTCKVEFKTVVTAWGKGKERELDAARSAAVWPEATDAQLCSDNLKTLLLTRLPKLIDEFKAAMENLGFVF